MDKMKLLIAVFGEKVPQEVLEGYVQNVDDALMKLPERYRSVLIKRFRGMTLEEIGLHLGVSRERIRQIQIEALRKLRHPSKLRILRPGWSPVKNTKSLSPELITKIEELKKYPTEELKQLPALDLPFSVRTHYCLRTLGIDTIGTLTLTTEKELLKKRNFGQTSLSEIKQTLTAVGLSLKDSKIPADNI